MNAHSVYVLHFPNMGGFQAKCACGSEFSPEQTRPDAIRHHTVHLAHLGQLR